MSPRKSKPVAAPSNSKRFAREKSRAKSPRGKGAELELAKARRAAAFPTLRRRSGDHLALVRRTLLAFPGVDAEPCHGRPGFRVLGKYLASLREDGETLVVKCGDDERDHRLSSAPEHFFVTEHYHGYPAVLIDLATVDFESLREVFERAWRLNAPKKLLAEYDRCP